MSPVTALAEALAKTGHCGDDHRVTLGIVPEEHTDHECLFSGDLTQQAEAILANLKGAVLVDEEGLAAALHLLNVPVTCGSRGYHPADRPPDCETFAAAIVRVLAESPR